MHSFIISNELCSHDNERALPLPVFVSRIEALEHVWLMSERTMPASHPQKAYVKSSAFLPRPFSLFGIEVCFVATMATKRHLVSWKCSYGPLFFPIQVPFRRTSSLPLYFRFFSETRLAFPRNFTNWIPCTLLLVLNFYPTFFYYPCTSKQPPSELCLTIRLESPFRAAPSCLL